MKRIFGILLLAFCAQANAEISAYQGTAAFFPDETSPSGLPDAIPCVVRPAHTGHPMLFCTWLTSTRYVELWDAQRQQNVRITNKVNGMCQRGNCRIQGAEVGNWKEDTPFQLSIWYRIGSSTDGKPVAYRVNTNRQVSYSEAGSLLMQFYVDAGVPDNELVSTFDKRYIGGWAAWNQDKAGAVSTVTESPSDSSSEWPEVKTAWCNPRMDDDCYINNKKVPIAELSKWLPGISESNADQLGGYCETILCFDENDQPMGYLIQ
ncbi:hypothetical protein NPS49_09605 [Pseudomonas putida]|uniref:hypothetical protein n=1 Tax=Pseudomonas putida TaxID=303 RepID=UPI0023639CC0|nr:hypothetical protein [Pseudomonas putida]MDD2068572.1 hypothetical protein [Pseudomonas putida]HDS1738508.1 hypothetical protein [Pseudomonas putida]